MSHLERIGKKMTIPIRADEEGYIGRECPECEGYFKITPGTGLTGSNLPCYCPYCGHVEGQEHYFSKEQIEYAKSVAFHKITGAFLDDLKSLEFNHQPRGGFGIGISLKVQGQPHPIHYYREKQLETEIVCDKCGLRYAIYGLFAYCPDCGSYNSLQILNKNFELIEKQVNLALTQSELAEFLLSDALENCVSSFDGFGQQICCFYGKKNLNLEKVDVSFQNIKGARKKIQELFGFDLFQGMALTDWQFIFQCFQKRHLLSHKMGIIDDAYIKATNDIEAVLGRKIKITASEVTALLTLLRSLGNSLIEQLEQIPEK